jgi:hypothetical protein
MSKMAGVSYNMQELLTLREYTGSPSGLLVRSVGVVFFPFVLCGQCYVYVTLADFGHFVFFPSMTHKLFGFAIAWVPYGYHYRNSSCVLN